MKFLHLSLVLCLVAGALANPELGSGDDSGTQSGGGGDEDLSTVTKTEVSTKRYKFTWLEKLMQGLQAGGAQNLIPPIEGSLNQVVTGTLDTARGSLKGLEPSIQAVYVTPVPTVRIVLAGAKIKICGPQTHVEFLLNHIICLVNGPLHLGLGVSPLPVCIKGKEKQCHGPYLRLPDTLTPKQIAGGCMGLCDSDWVGDMALQEIDDKGKVIGKIPVEGHTKTETKTEVNPSSSL